MTFIICVYLSFRDTSVQNDSLNAEINAAKAREAQISSSKNLYSMFYVYFLILRRKNIKKVELLQQFHKDRAAMTVNIDAKERQLEGLCSFKYKHDRQELAKKVESMEEQLLAKQEEISRYQPVKQRLEVLEADAAKHKNETAKLEVG